MSRLWRPREASPNRPPPLCPAAATVDRAGAVSLLRARGRLQTSNKDTVKYV